MKQEQYIKINSEKKEDQKASDFGCLLSPIKMNGIRKVSVSQGSIDAFQTLKSYLLTGNTEIKFKKNEAGFEVNLFFLIDSSASMAKGRQIAFVKGIIEQTLKKYKDRQFNYASVALINGGAITLSPLSPDPNVLLEKIETLRSGGKTNMKEGLVHIQKLMKPGRAKRKRYFLYVFTDGKINKGDTDDPYKEAVALYQLLFKGVYKKVIVDTETGFVKLGMAQRFAMDVGAKYESLMDMELS